MFERLQALFQSLTHAPPVGALVPGDPRIAIAALCFQVMEADGVVKASEQETLREALAAHYGLTGDLQEAVLAAGLRAEQEAVDYHRFTTDLKRQLDEAQREALVGILWDIVYADGVRSEMEDHVIWRIADLLGVSARARINLRQDAALRAGIGPAHDVT